ncbi:MAG: hypothetical protein ACXQS2_04330 [Methermicoccaceae archaeon]
MEIGDVIRIGSYGKYSSYNYGLNTLYVKVGNLTLYFSYDTVVAFKHPDYGFVVCENVFSPTTGKHLNWLDGGDKKGRVPYDKFKELLNEAMEKTFPEIFKSKEKETKRKMLAVLEQMEEEVSRLWVRTVRYLNL